MQPKISFIMYDGRHLNLQVDGPLQRDGRRGES